jgi:hypothetical protein
METHVRIAAWLRIAWSVLWLLLALAIALFVGGVLGELFRDPALQPDGDPTMDPVLKVTARLPIVVVVASVIMGVLTLPGLVTGWGLLTYRSWAPLVNVILSAFDLLLVPIGTVLGGYLIWVMLHPETVELFKAAGGERRYPSHF